MSEEAIANALEGKDQKGEKVSKKRATKPEEPEFKPRPHEVIQAVIQGVVVIRNKDGEVEMVRRVEFPVVQKDFDLSLKQLEPAMIRQAISQIQGPGVQRQ